MTYDNATNQAYGNGMEFVDGANAEIEYEYDENGNLAKDLNKNILNIEHNYLDLPSKVTFEDGNTIEYVYAADGTKLQTVHKIDGETTTRDYCGNAVYENGELKMLLNEYGYVSFPDRKFHFYLKDHQGNVRVVADAEGNVEEVNDYYPFGGLMSSATGNNSQPYKYNGKELGRKAGLNLYDYGARLYDPAIGRFTTNDRLAEKYYGLSPYQYAANNPALNIDVNGDSITVLNHTEGMHLAMLIQNEKGKWQYYSINGDNVYISGRFSGGRPFDDIAVGEFDSPMDFLDSDYNSEGDGENLAINHYGFSEGYVIPTNMQQDEIMRQTFEDISKNEEYRLIGNNCVTTVQRAMEAAGLTHYEQKVFNISINLT